MSSTSTGGTRPEPVLSAAKLAAAVVGISGALLTLLTAFGVTIEDNQRAAIMAVLVGVLTLVGVVAPYLTALKARAKVTPVSSPRSDDGTPLVAVADL